MTYDNNGNVIPLEERFNTKNPDIRFSKKVDEQVKKEYNNSRKNKETEDETVYGRRNEKAAGRISVPGRSGHPVHKDSKVEKRETLERSGGRNEQVGERKPRWVGNTIVSCVPSSYSELNDNVLL
ncbi:MAG: hypothetical protein J6K80_01880 [Oscillospiraceae bacterium]|nr:hypothetical protein [Oscillospiraceae bacterium]